MNTFDSTKRLLPEILAEIAEGNIQPPDFQRGWVWDDQHIRGRPPGEHGSLLSVWRGHASGDRW